MTDDRADDDRDDDDRADEDRTDEDRTDGPDGTEEAPPSIFDTLLTPLRLPGRVVSDVETLASRAGELVDGVRALLGAVDRIEGAVDRIESRVVALESLEGTITTRLDGLRSDLNERMGTVEHEVRSMRPPMDQIACDVQKLEGLLPNANDGPLTRLKDTLSSG